MKIKISSMMNRYIARTAWILILSGIVVLAVMFAGPMINKSIKKSINDIGKRIIKVTSPAPVIVEKLQELNRLETARQVEQQVVEAESESQILPDFLGKDNLMMFVQTETVAGIDLSSLSENNISVSKDIITIRLPAPEIFNVSINEQNSKVYLRQRGLLVFNPDIDLERQARLKAKSNALDSAMKGKMLNNARENAERSLRSLLKTLGFDNVEFKWDQSAISPASMA